MTLFLENSFPLNNYISISKKIKQIPMYFLYFLPIDTFINLDKEYKVLPMTNSNLVQREIKYKLIYFDKNKNTDLYSNNICSSLPSTFPKSIYQNVAYGLQIQGIKSKRVIDEKVEESLRKSALWDEVKDRLNENAYGLSGGQQQRLCIARTLAVEPEIILMDEPCSALDPVATGRVEELILGLKDEYTIVVVTHNMQQAGRISDRTAFFYLGKLIECDQTKKIFLNPNKQQTEDYISGKFG